MSKPGDIPQDVWKVAENALDDMLCNCIEASGTTEQFRIDNITPIARAIMAATAAEREACAKVAKGFRDRSEVMLLHCNSVMEKRIEAKVQDDDLQSEISALEVAIEQAVEIEFAIRNRA